MTFPKSVSIAPRRLTGDHAVGAAGVCLAVASAAFGIGMTLHGPVADLGKSREFTVFAQLAPRAADGRADKTKKTSPAQTTIDAQDLDTTATASIRSASPSGTEARDAAVIPSVTLEAVGTDSATVAIEGRTQIVRVGDIVEGAGEILAILPGGRPALRTTRGVIVPAGE